MEVAYRTETLIIAGATESFFNTEQEARDFLEAQETKENQRLFRVIEEELVV